MSRTDIVAVTTLGPAPRGMARLCALLVVPALGLVGVLQLVRGRPQLAALALAAALLGAVHLLSRLRRGSFASAMLLFLAGLAGGLAALNLAFDKAGFVRNILPNQQTAYLARQLGDKPVLLLMGSSLTQYGVDEALLEAELDKAGRPMRVLRLGYGGMSSIERYYYLRQLLKDPAFRPEAVLFEVSYYYEVGPLLQMEQNLYSDRMVEMMDPTSARLALEWIWRTPSMPFRRPAGLRERLTLAAHVLAHAALHYLRPGLLPVLVPAGALEPHPVSGRDIAKTAPLSDAEIARHIDAAYDGLKAAHDPAEVGLPNPWSDGLSSEMMELLRQRSEATRFGFFHLPTATPAEFVYAQLFCRDEKRAACISPIGDEALRGELRQQAYWLDPYHLHGPGRERVTRWLAGRILQSVAAP